jgi:hypothetical protein
VVNRRPLRPGEKLNKAELPEEAKAEEVQSDLTPAELQPDGEERSVEIDASEIATPVAKETETASDAPVTEGSRPADEEVATPEATETAQDEGVEEVQTLSHQGPPVRRARRKE